MLDVFTEGDKTRQRRNQRPHSPDIHPKQKGRVVLCKLREQDGRGDIADQLAGEDREEKGALVKKLREELPHRIDARHIAGKDKEEYEGEKKRVVHPFEGAPIEKEERKRNDNKPDRIRDHTEDDQDGEGKKEQINGHPPGG